MWTMLPQKPSWWHLAVLCVVAFLLLDRDMFVVTPDPATPAVAATDTNSTPRLLLIIQGGYRTMDLTVDSIIHNLCLANGGCKIALSLSTIPLAVSADVRRKLAPYLIAEYYKELTDVQSPHYIFE